MTAPNEAAIYGPFRNSLSEHLSSSLFLYMDFGKMLIKIIIESLTVSANLGSSKSSNAEKKGLDILKYGTGSIRETDVREDVRGYDNFRTADDKMAEHHEEQLRQLVQEVRATIRTNVSTKSFECQCSGIPYFWTLAI